MLTTKIPSGWVDYTAKIMELLLSLVSKSVTCELAILMSLLLPKTRSLRLIHMSFWYRFDSARNQQKGQSRLKNQTTIQFLEQIITKKPIVEITDCRNPVMGFIDLITTLQLFLFHGYPKVNKI